MKLRPYQNRAIQSVEREFKNVNSTLIDMATGLGKTVVFSHIIRDLADKRALVLAHRAELIYQAAEKIREVTGEAPGIEMANERVGNSIWSRDATVVSSIQTQNAGRGKIRRMHRFNPKEFSHIIVDEAHHAVSPSYRRVIDYYRTENPDVQVLGVTATPDRLDECGLGHVFDTCAFQYGILNGIKDGWLVPIKQRTVHVEDLDFSSVRTVAGDFNGADLQQIVESEKMLHEYAGPTIEISGGRKTLIFAASVKQAERLAEILNRHQPGSADFVFGNTPKDQRKYILQNFRDRKFQYLVNVGVFTEGFDDPSIELIVMARPTKSRALYAQMVGRGTRALPGVVDGPNSPDLRKQAIAESGKTCVEILDFSGNAGQHKLLSVVDVLGGEAPEEVKAHASEALRQSGNPMDAVDQLEQSEEEIERCREEERKQREEVVRQANRRREIKARAKFKTRDIDPFNLFEIEAPMSSGPYDEPATEKQVSALERFKIPNAESYTKREASTLLNHMISRMEKNRCTFKQAKLLNRYGYDADVSMKEASTIIDSIARNGWRKPKTEEVPAWER